MAPNDAASDDSQTTLAKLRRRRGSYKKELTQFEKLIASIQDQQGPTLDDHAKAKLRLQLPRFQLLIEHYDAVNIDIAETDPDDSELDSDAFTQRYFEVFAIANSLVEPEGTQSQRASPSVARSDNAQSSSTASSSTSIESLHKKRTQCEHAISTFENYISSLELLGELNEQSRLMLQLRLEKFRNIVSSYDSITQELDLVEPSDSNFSYDETSNRCFAAIIAATTLEKRATAAQQQRSTLQPARDVRLPLPTITIKPFSGQYEEWIPFREKFVSLIHDNATLDDTQRFHHLVSSLRGDAEQAIKAIPMAAANYTTAWSTLKLRYENKKRIATIHIRALFDAPTVTRESDTALYQLLNCMTNNVEALRALGDPVEYWDRWLVFIIASKLDSNTRREWELHSSETDTPTFNELKEFVRKRCHYLEALDSKRGSHQQANQRIAKTSAHVTTTVRQPPKCPHCQVQHYINQCRKFLQLDIPKRIDAANKAKLCLNCLRPNHDASNCPGGCCRICNGRHNTLLHQPTTLTTVTREETVAVQRTHNDRQTSYLPTAIAEIKDSKNQWRQCRVLLDTAAESNFITNACAKELMLKCYPANVAVSGINASNSRVSRGCPLQLRSRFGKFVLKTNCYVIDHITKTPKQFAAMDHARIPSNITLADPCFATPSCIDVLIGSSHVFSMMCIGQIRETPSHPLLQKTVLGWVTSGSMLQQHTHLTEEEKEEDALCINTHDLVQQFWTMESLPKRSILTIDERTCEDHFIRTHTRLPNGVFQVRLPFKTDPSALGESRTIAEKRLYSLEKRLQRNPTLKSEYCRFIHEYLQLNHMREVNIAADVSTEAFYLPHHAVLRANSLTTKLRVVFDGSCKTTSGVSLNDTLHTGAKQQEDIIPLLLRFRLHRYVMTADIAKMFRQICVHKDDTKFQRILWRENENQPVKTYELSTVTYGTTAAPFLARRCLQQLAEQDSTRYPIGAMAILEDFYVDDLLTGHETIEGCQEIARQTTALLSSAGFELRKWTSNNADVLSNMEDEKSQKTVEFLVLNKDAGAGPLGIHWNKDNDDISYNMPEYDDNRPPTKRRILACVASLFDPLGLISPVLVQGKLILQQLWQLQVDWDESLPQDMHTLWLSFVNDLNHLSLLKIPRRIFHDSSDCSSMELHGFSDASEQAYGACVYGRTKTSTGYHVQLICSKSRVAPLKATTIPRLELCAALLLTQLMETVQESTKAKVIRKVYWTDSTIVLAWLHTTSRSLKTFVAHRVAEIQDHTDATQWRHVDTHSNPADIVSRGSAPSDLVDSIWWTGPNWLKLDENEWPIPSVDTPTQIPEVKISALVIVEVDTTCIDRFSSMDHLIRVIARCRRLRVKQDQRYLGPITTEETTAARRCIVKLEQQNSFGKEIEALRKGQQISTKSQLQSLDPFLDDDGVLRVGGRIRQATLPFENKHQAILPRSSHLTRLIIRAEHQRRLHAGVQVMLASLRQRYWIIGGRSPIKHELRRCIQCIKAKPTHFEHIMGDLPASRITPMRPFERCGIDFAGPIQIKEGGRRSKKYTKVYIALFVCFVTKAVHLEIVSNLTSEACIAALRRMIARRGRIRQIWSDNATNFVGANNELRELQRMFCTNGHKPHQGNVQRRHSMAFHPSAISALWRAVGGWSQTGQISSTSSV